MNDNPTFTPLREETGQFKAFLPPPQQKKKAQNDPKWDNINPEIIALCSRNGMARGCMELYLNGDLTWMECLEIMVIALGKELVLNQSILIDQRREVNELKKAVNRQPVLTLPTNSLLALGETENDAFFERNKGHIEVIGRDF